MKPGEQARKEGGTRPETQRAKIRGIAPGLGALAASILVVLSPVTLGAVPHTTVHAPYKGGVLPYASLTVSGCHALAKQPTPWHFHLKTGVGGGSDLVSTRSCPQVPYRLGSSSSASASGSAEVSIAIHVPRGMHNVSVVLSLNYTSTIRESAGSPSGACPTTPSRSSSASYYDGSSWSYSPSIKGPIVYSNKTYYYNSQSHGRSGSCSAFSSANGGVVGFIVASNGLAGYSLTPSSFQFGGYVWGTNSTYWSCSNYTLWSYGTWANGTPSCYTSNNSLIQTCVYSCSWPTVSNFTPSLAMTFKNSTTIAMWTYQNFSVSRTWDLFIQPFGSLTAYSYGFPHGSAYGALNMATLGNGVALKSITVT